MYPLKVGVRHCSLEHAPYCVLVGHFQGLPLTGAEARLNERSEGRLERLLLMNQYPQQLGESAIFQPVDEAPPNGMVVVGLGPSGELTAAELRGVVVRALVRVALNELDQRLARPIVEGTEKRQPPLGVSSILIGTSAGGGLPVEASVRALIDGVNAANSRLARMKVFIGGREVVTTDVVRFDHLELVERYEDRVDLVISVLAEFKRLGQREAGSAGESLALVTYLLKPVRGEGASSANPPTDTSEEVWRRVDIRSHCEAGTPIGKIEFTSIGRLARAERILEAVELDLVNELLRDAIDDHADRNISGTLYELLIPQELKGELGSSEHLHLLVDDQTADVPWELLSPRSDDDEYRVPLALRAGVLRQFRDSEHLRFDLRRASGNNVLVIGNPPVPNAPPLPGAVHESRAVESGFKAAQWTVEALIWDTKGKFVGSDPTRSPRVSGVDALHTMLNRDWRVVHIAAHGQFTGQDETTGVQLGAVRLTANTFSKMSVVPDLVIINCCHLGRVAAGPQLTLDGANRAAASVGRTLLQIGVRAIVVAGWAVDDKAAEAFASTLVKRLLDGCNFGSAVIYARDAAHHASPESLTWGAYQCYGDPGFSLVPSSGHADGNDVHTTGELRRRIGQLASSVGDQGGSAATCSAIQRQLVELEDRVQALGATSVYADLADAWARLLDCDRAVRLYEMALDAGDSDVPVRSIEQLGNMLSRRARRTALAGGDPQKVTDDLDGARTWLQRALEVGQSGERLALLGGHHKRAAAIRQGAARTDHLREAIAAYSQAYQLSPKPYHLLNCVQLVELARLNGVPLDEAVPVEGKTERADGELNLVEPALVPPSPLSEAVAAADFWQRSVTGDRLVTAILIDARVQCVEAAAADQVRRTQLDQDVDVLVRHYVAAFRLRSTPAERASVIEHLRDLADLAPGGTSLALALAGARERLECWPACPEPSLCQQTTPAASQETTPALPPARC